MADVRHPVYCCMDDVLRAAENIERRAGLSAAVFSTFWAAFRALGQALPELPPAGIDKDHKDAPVASELDIEMGNMLKAANPLIEVARPAPPLSAHGGAPPVIPPAGVYGNKALEDGDPKASKVGVFYSRTGSTWFSVEGTVSFDRTMADENWTFMGWLKLRSVP